MCVCASDSLNCLNTTVEFFTFHSVKKILFFWADQPVKTITVLIDDCFACNLVTSKKHEE